MRANPSAVRANLLDAFDWAIVGSTEGSKEGSKEGSEEGRNHMSHHHHAYLYERFLASVCRNDDWVAVVGLDAAERFCNASSDEWETLLPILLGLLSTQCFSWQEFCDPVLADEILEFLADTRTATVIY